MQMDYLIFRDYLKYIGVIEAEERFILQRQLDNHIKIKSPKLIDSFTDIYKEFESVINPDVKIVKKTTTKIDAEKAKAIWGEMLGKLK